MDNIKKTLLIVSCLLIIACGYIVTDKINLCETAKNESYNAGFNQGRESWNKEVIYNINTNSKVPYWFNGTYYELPVRLGE